MLNFFAPINHLGYGVHSYNLIAAYEEHVSQDFALFPVRIPEFQNERIDRWVQKGRHFSRQDPSLMICQAMWLNHFCGNPLIGFPVFELDVLPEYDRNVLRQLDVLVQTSEWGKRVLEQHGFKRVYVVPEGYDPRTYFPTLSLEHRLERIQRQGVSFVHVGKFEARKSSAEILRGFVRACDDGNARANLMFHAFNLFDNQWQAKVEQILGEAGFSQVGTHFVHKNTRVVVPPGRIKEDELRQMYQMAEFGVWASKAEGWNLPLIECIACGIPCLTTTNTAQADFIRAGIYPEELILASHQQESTREGGEWWPIDEAELTEKIRAIIQAPEKFLRMEGRCLESIREFTWENAAKRLGEVLGEIGIRI